MKPEQQLKSNIAKREQMRSQLVRFSEFLEKFDNTRTILELSTRLEKIEEIWPQFISLQSEIELLDNSNEQEEERKVFEEQYFRVVTQAKALILDSKKVQTGSNVERPCSTLLTSTNKSVNLPKLDLPKFRGHYEEWQAFHDVFEALVNRDETLTNTQKFMYLNSCLEGEANNITDSLTVTEDNYSIAWELLRKRYENKRSIVNAHINSILDFPIMTKESYQCLRKLVDGVTKHVRALKNLKLPTEHWDHILINILTRKLDGSTRREWEKSIKPKELPSMQIFLDFLSNKCQILESLQPSNTNFNNKVQFNTRQFRGPEALAHVSTQDSNSCELCKGTHLIYSCRDFLKLPVKSRIFEVKRMNLCLNCLKADHFVSSCLAGSCKTCHKKHNSLLHFDYGKDSNSGSQTNQHIEATVERNSTVATHCVAKGDTQIILATAVIKITSSRGVSLKCRALLDSGSQSNFVTSRVAVRLGLPITKTNSPIVGINQIATSISSRTEAVISSVHNGYSKNVNFLVLTDITKNIPNVSFNPSLLNIPNNITLADPTYYKTDSIDILLGAEVFFDLLCVGQIKLGPGKPILQKSHLGWIISGPLFLGTSRSNTTSFCNLSLEDNVHNALERFWNIEECTNKRAFTSEEVKCEIHFVANTRRTDSGRFIVSLPIRENCSPLGDSLEMATKRFSSLEKKFSKDALLKKSYVEFLREYEALGHMSKIEHTGKSFDQGMIYYLPHHGVVKDSSFTTKLRVVYDASARSSSDVSLNNILMVGPTLQEDLFSIITRFRKHDYVFVADIEKMYRQVLVSERDRDLQRILWRTNPDEPLQHYRLNTVTYGTAPASFLAVRCLHELAYQNKSTFPTASQTILSDFYVDDLITGSNSLENARQLKHDIDIILKSGGFVLRKWVANDPRILDDLKQGNEVLPHFYITDDSSVKTLGILWDAKSDIFQFTISINCKQKITKRTILSTIAHIFDPLGLVGPAIIKAKIMLQNLWQLRLDWDESVPSHIFTEFCQFRNQLSILSELQFPRQVTLQNACKIELHGFCDASMAAYGACLYVKSYNVSGEISIRLLCSKSRVAPLKGLTLPRLELCAAVLLAQLADKAIQSLQLNFHATSYWSDSTIVLSWISSQSSTWKTFVSNRIAEIQRLTSIENWHHVRSEDNPADIISRGLNPEKLLHCSLWWSGPSWLLTDTSFRAVIPTLDTMDLPESKPQPIVMTTIVDQSIFLQFSSFTKLQRMVAYCLRFKKNTTTHKGNKLLQCLNSDELNEALTVLVKIVQSSVFTNDLINLKKHNKVNATSRLISLSPFLDTNGIIKVGGRLSNAALSFERKHPIVLPHDHPFTHLLIITEHQRLLHAGPQATLASIRSRFWVLRGRSVVKKLLKNCIPCFKAKPVSPQPFMGDLPGVRVNPVRPFYNTGVDFAGPFLIKDGKLRNRKIIKCYMCIFICLSIKAVHIELVSDLSKDAFLNAIKRFTARRGLCKNIFSDNGANLHGADNELKRVLSKIDQETNISNYLSQQSIMWHFSPARSPHFGGIWEAAVKAAKYHAKRILSSTPLTFEHLSTIFTQIEAILNSRPLTPLSSDPSDLLSLTPGHFLIGDALASIPVDMVECSVNLSSAYRTIQQMHQHFWKRWKTEYIALLQQRSKWRSKKETFPLQPGTMVLLKEENVPPLCWPLGRITKLHPGKDDVVRVVSVKTRNSEVTRAVTKICILPIETDSIKMNIVN